jgi:hypothetical protein
MKLDRIAPALALVLLLPACRALFHPTPSDKQIQADLVGQRFAYADGLLSSPHWTIEPHEITGWRIVRRATDRRAGIDVVHASVHLDDGHEAISGTLRVTYRLYDQGWQLESIHPEGEFSVVAAKPAAD